MSLEMKVTIIGAVLSAIGAGIAIWQAMKAKSERERLESLFRKMYLDDVSGFLKHAQAESNKMLNKATPANRGDKIQNDIQGYIDKSVNLLYLTGPDSDIRKEIIRAQDQLEAIRDSEVKDSNKERISNMHKHFQKAISLCKERVSGLELRR